MINNILSSNSERGELLFEHIVPGAAAEAALQHPLPHPRHHQQRTIGHRRASLPSHIVDK